LCIVISDDDSSFWRYNPFVMNFLPKEKSKIAVGLSGGVDSATTAMLLKNQGHDVTGVYLQCWEHNGPGCSGDPARSDAVKVATHLGIKYAHLDFIQPYKDQVIDYFYKSYELGLTPNPDILCNTVIKFGLFLDWALNEGFDYVATGHYAQKFLNADSTYDLYSGVDSSKDQSYFLYRLDQKKLSKAIFPIGEMTKKNIRILAKENGIPVHDKPDSTGICFVGDVDIRDFLKERLKVEKGNVVDTQGEIIGTHEGVWFYTVGQRHGFELTKYVGVPLYVVSKDVEKNNLIVGPIREAFRSEFLVNDLHWVNSVPEMSFSSLVRIRNLGEFYECEALVDGSTLRVSSSREVFGVAPGQSAVFYEKNSFGLRVLGGGIIE